MPDLNTTSDSDGSSRLLSNQGDALVAPAYREAQAKDLPAIKALWAGAGLSRPYNPPGWDVAFCLRAVNSQLYVLMEGETLVGSVMAGHDGQRGWLYFVATDPEAQGKRAGGRMVAEAERWLRKKGVWKIELFSRASPAPISPEQAS